MSTFAVLHFGILVSLIVCCLSGCTKNTTTKTDRSADQKGTQNWAIAAHREHMEIITHDFPDSLFQMLKSRGIHIHEDLSSVKTIINWKLYPQAYIFYYDYVGGESTIAQALKKSRLAEHDYVYMDYGNNGPLVRIEVATFIDHWYDFVSSTQYESLIFTEDGSLFFEFTEDYYLAWSNFFIHKDNVPASYRMYLPEYR